MPLHDQYRGGSGEPLVLLHGIQASWKVWQPVLPILSRSHDVLAPTLPGHLDGPPLELGAPVSIGAIADGVEQILDANGIATAHLVGNSLGGWLAIELGRRDRARSVVGLSPAGGWTSARDLRRVVWMLSSGRAMMGAGGRIGLNELIRRPGFRRLAFRGVMEHGDRVTPSEAAEMLTAAAGCDAFPGFLTWVRTAGSLPSADVTQDYPIRIAWAEQDKTIPFGRYGLPMLAVLPGTEQVMLPGVGHVPMFDDPELIARTILEVTVSEKPNARSRPNVSSTDTPLNGTRGTIVVRVWDAPDPQRVVVLAHGIGEHSGRYDYAAERLNAAGSTVYAPDHHGHGRSDGEPGLVSSIEAMVDDLRLVVDRAKSDHPDLPIALLGHSLGGMIVTRYIQRGDDRISAAVMTGPPIGGNPAFEGLLGLDPMPDVPIDPAILSRDPEVGRAYMEDPLVYHGPLARESLQTIFATVEEIATGPGFGSLPVMWLHGEDDQLAPLESTRLAIERLRGEDLTEVVYPGAQHEVLNETNRDEVIDAVIGFLSARLSTAPTVGGPAPGGRLASGSGNP
jgi:alpha-beta hydrolase superfamily lysophospholipase